MATPLNKSLRTPRRKCMLSTLNEEELKIKISKLLENKETLSKEIKKLEEEGVNADLRSEMQALHEYNDIKDFTQSVLGYLANIQNEPLADVHKRYNLPTS